LPIHILPIAPQSSSSSSGAGTIGQTVAAVPSGLSLTSPPRRNNGFVGLRYAADVYQSRVFFIVLSIDIFIIRKGNLDACRERCLYFIEFKWELGNHLSTCEGETVETSTEMASSRSFLPD
jgi:hypothetical protein